MTTQVAVIHGRRAFLLAAAAALGGTLAACGGDEPTQEESAPTTSSLGPQAARDAAETLLRDAQLALDEAFDGLTWEDSTQEQREDRDGGCRLSLPSRRCDTYLGKDPADHEPIAAALTTALEAHGLPSAPTPTGGTGGWLTTSSTGDGITLSFRSKGFAELSVRVDLAQACDG